MSRGDVNDFVEIGLEIAVIIATFIISAMIGRQYGTLLGWAAFFAFLRLHECALILKILKLRSDR